MPLPPTPEEAGSRVLSAFKELKAEAGFGFDTRVFAKKFNEDGWSLSSLEAGLQYAMEQRWIGQNPKGGVFTLTREGYEAICREKI